VLGSSQGYDGDDGDDGDDDDGAAVVVVAVGDRRDEWRPAVITRWEYCSDGGGGVGGYTVVCVSSTATFDTGQ
jgi:hypothetical protein